MKDISGILQCYNRRFEIKLEQVNEIKEYIDIVKKTEKI